MFNKLLILLISMFFLFSGCADNSAIKTEISLEEPEQTSSNVQFLLPHIDGYKNNEDLLYNIGAAKFSEYDKSIYNPQTIDPLEELTELYKPGYLKPSFTLSSIGVAYINKLFLNYQNAITEEFAGFDWQMSILAENATKDFFGRGGTLAEYIEERNGIAYYIMECPSFDTDDFSSYEIGWTQHGQTFRSFLPASFTLEEVLAFCDAQPIEAWELLGDAVSVSIQDMENVSIFENDSVSKMPSRNSSNEIIALDDVLYKSVNMEKVGYRWLIDENTTRYQYVLAPDTYEFHASGVGNDPELLVKHFEAGDIMATEDLTSSFEDPAVNGFTLTVAPEGIVEFTVDTEPYAI